MPGGWPHELTVRILKGFSRHIMSFKLLSRKVISLMVMKG